MQIEPDVMAQFIARQKKPRRSGATNLTCGPCNQNVQVMVPDTPPLLVAVPETEHPLAFGPFNALLISCAMAGASPSQHFRISSGVLRLKSRNTMEIQPSTPMGLPFKSGM